MNANLEEAQAIESGTFGLEKLTRCFMLGISASGLRIETW
jgi:hypothetical protein